MADIKDIKIDSVKYNIKLPSDRVNSMADYTKPSSAPATPAIQQSDTLNQAVGKLEYKADANQTNILSVEDMICDTEFSTSTAYAVGDIVTYEHGLYEFTSAHSAGAWNSAEVTEVNVVDKIGSGGGGSVDSVSVGGGTPYTPDANGNIDLPAYPTPNTYTGSGAISVNSSTNVISHSTSAGYKHIPSGGSTGQFLKYSSSGTASWQPLPYGSESAQGAVRVWVTTVGSDTVLHISNQAAT